MPSRPSPDLPIHPHPRCRHTAAPASKLHAPARTCLAAPLLALLALLAILATSGCTPLLIGGAAVGAASTIHDRRSPDAILDDQQIELMAMSALLGDQELRGGTRISITSYNRTALLTGQADTTELARRAADLVSRQPKVARVVDEVAVGPRASLSRQSEDTYITAQVKAALLGIKLPEFDPTRVKVVTESGVVYLMGRLRPEEANAATEKARYVPGVARVVRLFEDFPSHG
ncbi:MAG: BON domain-containing protein [Sphingobacteriia bacterium]|nr:BON domain-containing protein [Sphingobacteriia bacterium]NCC39523.1 BON domain-containing protein [Gammaproteobacteria bacterium]